MNPALMFDAQRQQLQHTGGTSNSPVAPPSADDPRIALLNQLGGANNAENMALLSAQQQRNLSFTTQGAAQRSVMEVLARHNTTSDGSAEEGTPGGVENKRKGADDDSDQNKAKKQRVALSTDLPPDDDNGPAPVAASEEGLSYFNDNDVLSGRGGGTNVHPGNRHFRDLINVHRRAYLKARKNDKPAISRAIVRSVRENQGRFLKRDEKSGLWYEIGDDAAREKTSQALRQRAPEMRKILFESEREQARQEAEEQLRQQQQFIASGLGGQDLSGIMSQMNGGLNPMLGQQGGNSMLNPLLAMQMNKQALGGQMGNLQNDPYSQMSQNLMTAALLGGGINRYTPNGA